MGTRLLLYVVQVLFRLDRVKLITDHSEEVDVIRLPHSGDVLSTDQLVHVFHTLRDSYTAHHHHDITHPPTKETCDKADEGHIQQDTLDQPQHGSLTLASFPCLHCFKTGWAWERGYIHTSLAGIL